ncbi:MAG: transcriptional repressor NrdR [Planctomycetes bacterium]|nr:transcriptional repressor NrdR [Planctomycetota bacterium]
MLCPFCRKDDDKVVDSRSANNGMRIRRRRQCLKCSQRYTTYETWEEIHVSVVKKDGTRVDFDRGKILTGLKAACNKRPISQEVRSEIADRIEDHAKQKPDRVIASSEIGEMIMQELARLDRVAYVRFASVYRNFSDTADFTDTISALKGLWQPSSDPPRS